MANTEHNTMLTLANFADMLYNADKPETRDMVDYLHAIATDLSIDQEKRRIAKALLPVLRAELKRY